MKIAIFGKSGQLGCDIAEALGSHSVVPTDGARVDVTDPEAVNTFVSKSGAEWVVNCAAMTHVDRCESEAVRAFEVNAMGARNVARACAENSAALVHVSTDYVFDGTKSDPYVESDAPRAINVYGMTKLVGEWFVIDNCPRHFVLRTSGLYGTHECRGKGTNFVETMLRLGGEGKQLSIVEDELLTPTFTEDVAALVARFIEHAPPPGIYHATNRGSCSWHDFAVEIFRQSNMDVEVTGITSHEWGAPARRPANSVLANRALDRIGMNDFADWQDALSRYLARRPR